MIDHLDELLRTLLLGGIPTMSPSDISFNPPDQTWRNQVSGGKRLLLNVYLIELRENLSLRSNERHAQTNGGVTVHTRAPARLDCHYLISAWSPEQPTALGQPSIDEDVLLYDVARVLFDAVPLDATAIYGPGALPAGFPPELLDPPLPAVVAPNETFPKLADFWMRMDTVWRPVVDLTVTIPVAYAPRLAGVPVTTLTTRSVSETSGASESIIDIGGVVRVGAGPSAAPLAGAWVRLVELNQLVTSDSAGQFLFTRIRPGTYTLQAGAPGHAVHTATVDVPSLSGSYDISLP